MYIVSAFFYIFDLAVKRSRLTQGHHLNSLVVLEFPVLRSKFEGHRSNEFVEEDLLFFFIIYQHGGHVGHVTWTI